MSDIKPKMVGGEWVCDPVNCPAFGNTCTMCSEYIRCGVCAPYYRTALADAEATIEQLRARGDFEHEPGSPTVFIHQAGLMLPNGTVVNRGDVLADSGFDQYPAETHKYHEHLEAIKVTAVGDMCVVGWLYKRNSLTEIWHRWDARRETIVEIEGMKHWRPWLEVYPDRPVPGGE